jgi:hypothetical protein
LPIAVDASNAVVMFAAVNFCGFQFYGRSGFYFKLATCD